jgi:fatty-acid desaturase
VDKDQDVSDKEFHFMWTKTRMSAMGEKFSKLFSYFAACIMFISNNVVCIMFFARCKTHSDFVIHYNCLLNYCLQFEECLTRKKSWRWRELVAS